MPILNKVERELPGSFPWNKEAEKKDKGKIKGSSSKLVAGKKQRETKKKKKLKKGIARQQARSQQSPASAASNPATQQAFSFCDAQDPGSFF